MSNVLIINGHQPYPFSKGELNATLVDRARAWLEARGHTVQVTSVAGDYEVESEVRRHVWADVVIMQFPVNWMGVPWSFKKYMDEVYTAGMDGRLCQGDGRREDAPKVGYGTGGALGDTHYMLSVTFNAPEEAFGNPEEPFFAGGSVDDLLRPQHLNARFFNMRPMPTFAAYDVMKNPQVELDLVRFDAHLAAVFADGRAHAA